MERPIVVVGLGEMGGVFARAFLSVGYPVYPVLRHRPIAETAATVPDPALVLVTVGEADLDEALDGLPAPWRRRVGLIQNELLPPDWARHGIDDPTVATVWFEKKPGRPVRVIVPTLVAGPQAELVVTALDRLGIAVRVIHRDQLVNALVAKNLYILTANIGGLSTGGTVSELWQGHPELAAPVASEVLDIQEHLVGEPIDREMAMAEMIAAFAADPEHGSTGRSAPRRLQRALRFARDAGIATPTLDAIAEEVTKK
ncbi:MAG: hypothetical protein BMS9Abin07_0047 [Acidimicrobiia bacterium]|nr:MAG: hypothetical protein BMS9Abin07_0047 [Acidimicrobiia bacterium]